MLENTNAYLAAYVLIIMFSLLVISIDGFSVGTNFSAVLACFNNIGPGLELVGPTCNFSIYGPLAKIVLIFDMLAGRLEIFPIFDSFVTRYVETLINISDEKYKKVPWISKALFLICIKAM